MHTPMGWLRSLASAALFVGSTVHAQTPPPVIDTVARMRAEATIRLGVRDSAPPFVTIDAAGKPSGFSWELCRAVVRQLEADLKQPLRTMVVPVSLAGSFEMLQDGRIDLQCGSTTHTTERARRVDFSNSFFVSGIAVAYRRNDVQYANPLKFGRVAVLAGSTVADIMARSFAHKGSTSIDAVVPIRRHEDGKIDMLTVEAWRRPSRDRAPQLY